MVLRGCVGILCRDVSAAIVHACACVSVSPQRARGPTMCLIWRAYVEVGARVGIDVGAAVGVAVLGTAVLHRTLTHSTQPWVFGKAFFKD